MGCLSEYRIIGKGNNIGGLVGFDGSNANAILNSSARGEIKVDGENIGGLVGVSQGEIRNCHTQVSVSGSNNVGGLIGYSLSEVLDSYSCGDVLGDGQDGGHFGGFVGTCGGSLVNSYATGNVRVEPLGEHSVVGGLVGWLDEEGTIWSCYATGDVIGQSEVGGLVGGSLGEIVESYATGAITGERTIGGLVGIERRLLLYDPLLQEMLLENL